MPPDSAAAMPMRADAVAFCLDLGFRACQIRVLFRVRPGAANRSRAGPTGHIE